MGINVFQVGNLNVNMFHVNAPTNPNSGMYASEFPINLDNINANASRYVKLMGVWANVGLGATQPSPSADSFGQATGSSNNPASQSFPIRPNGGFFTRGVWFSGTATAPNPNRNGYIGSYVGGLGFPAGTLDYTHDTNPGPMGGVDYEPVYGHGQASWPMTIDLPHQWLDATSHPSDGSDAIVNSSSAYTRTAYMPPSYFLFHIDSVGSNTLGSASVKFHLEHRPTSRITGFQDGNSEIGGSSNQPGSVTYGGPTYGPYDSDPLADGGFGTPTTNPYEYYQASGARKLNSRGLSLHLAKVFDNGYNAYGYVYEEDGVTLAPNAHGAGPHDASVNSQTEYTPWLGLRDRATDIASVSAVPGTVTINAPISAALAATGAFNVGAKVQVQGMQTATFLNGQFVTIATLLGGGPSYTGFTAVWNGGTYAQTPETQGYVVSSPDTRVQQAATFVINEEYYGFVADTKCTIWSNKASMIPLLFFDLADIWSSSVAPRIAGVAVRPTGGTYQLFFISEDGMLARYDFTQTNGVLELAGTGSFSAGTNAPTPSSAGQAYGAMQLSNDGTKLWALYGTMVADPRTTQTGLAATATIAIYQYVIATNTWTLLSTSPLTGRHNARNLKEMIVKRDGRIYILCEAVTVTGSFDVANAAPTWNVTAPANPYAQQSGLINYTNIYWQLMVLDPTGPTWNASQLNGNNTASITSINQTWQSFNYITVTAVNTFQPGQWVTLTGLTNPNNTYLNGATVQVLVTNLSGTQFSFSNVPALNNGVQADTGSATSVISYGDQFGTPFELTINTNRDYWNYNINCHMYDVAPNKLLIQGNWTGTEFFVVDTTGAPTLTNTNVSYAPIETLIPLSLDPSSLTYANIGGGGVGPVGDPSFQPITVQSAIDGATNGDRTIFFLQQFMTYRAFGNPASGNISLYYAPPSYNWASPGSLSVWFSNPTGSPSAVTASVQKDYWTAQIIGSQTGAFNDHSNWNYPVQLRDDYITWARSSTGSQDGIPSQSTYGRAAGQTISYVPSYWKWTGSAWVLADNWNDAFTNPYTIPSANTNIPLPYGLPVQFGPASGTPWTGGEFHTWNIAWGNTKYTRKGRFTWAMFAGQTFVNTETRTMASENVLSVNFVDTDYATVTVTGQPTSSTPLTATITTPNRGWLTQATWPKLDASNNPFDATTPFQMVLESKNFMSGSIVNNAAYNVSGSNPYSWTVNSFTYTSSSSAEQSQFPSWHAFAGSPGNDSYAFPSNPVVWTSSSGSLPQYVELDLGAGNTQTVLSYGYRNLYDTSDNLSGGAPTAWTLQASNDGSFTDNAGGPFILDTRSGFTSSTLFKGMAFNCNGTTGSHRYYRFNITAVNSGGSAPAVGMIRLSSAVLQTTMNFSDLAFNAYGSAGNINYFYPWQRNWNFVRGLTFEVSTTPQPGPYTFTTILPLWRAHQGSLYTFPRQTGITAMRVTVQQGQQFATFASGGGNQPNVQSFGPFYLFDYGTQGQIDAARLGINSGFGTAVAASFDPQCIGVATDVVSLSIDSANPSTYGPFGYLADNAVFSLYDFGQVPALLNIPSLATNVTPYKIHPFYGFILMPGAGADGAVSTQTGTNMVIEYQWGRRV